MAAQQWVNVIVALMGMAGTITGHWFGARGSRKAAILQQEMHRADERRSVRESYCRDFLSSVRLVRLSGVDDDRSPLFEARRAAAGIELYLPELADERLSRVMDAMERLIRLRTDGGWSESIAETEQDFDHAIAALREAMREKLTVEPHV